MSGRRWLLTVWHGGNNAQPEPRYRVLAASPAAATFHHQARVRMGEYGPEGYFLEDSEVRPKMGQFVTVPIEARWRRLEGVGGARIAAALLAQAEAEQLAEVRP